MARMRTTGCSDRIPNPQLTPKQQTICVHFHIMMIVKVLLPTLDCAKYGGEVNQSPHQARTSILKRVTPED